jgi:hypothetical protein
MNLDLFANFEHGDAQGLAQFMMAHRFIHNQESEALTAQFGASISTFGLTSAAAEQEWIDLMQNGKGPSTALQDWLKFHADMHVKAYTLLGQSATAAPDLSEVNFASEDQFYEWMLAHQSAHDFEQNSLGLT